MRDPERIERIMSMVQQIWKLEPDMRIFQLMAMLESRYSKANNAFGRPELFEKEESRGTLFPHNIVELFHLEDDVLEPFLASLLAEQQVRKSGSND